MPSEKAKERIAHAQREVESRRQGEGVSMADVGRDLAEVKLTLAETAADQAEIREMLLGDGKEHAGVIADLRDVKQTLANYTRVVWMFVAIVTTSAGAILGYRPTTEKLPHHPAPIHEAPSEYLESSVQLESP